MKIGEVKITDKDYPKLLRGIKNPPKKLFYKGDWNKEIFQNCLAVVGSRRMTDYGEKITRILTSEVALSGITIVSGFMYGIDVTAHKAAVDIGGKTIAVMPCGIDLIHPAYQRELYEKIIKRGGLVVSEYAKNQSPAKWTYIERNRIVAGLSGAILVVQAAEKSGSLITANYGKEFQRKLFAVPGPLTSSVSIGTTKLIKEGASIVAEAKDVISFYDLKQSSMKFEKPKGIGKSNKTENRIVRELKKEPLEINGICRKLKISVREAGVIISEMELKGVIKEEFGKYYLN